MHAYNTDKYIPHMSERGTFAKNLMYVYYFLFFFQMYKHTLLAFNYINNLPIYTVGL